MTRRLRNPKLLILVLADCIALVAIVLSRDRFSLSLGSDAPNLILGPTQGGQAFCVIVILAISLALFRLRGFWLLPLSALWLLYSLDASHRVVFDVVRNSVRDTYATITVQSLQLDQFDGHADRLISRTGPLSINLQIPGRPIGLSVFAGVPPARLDLPPK